VGSLICGPAEFIDRARRNRRMVGGTMRQAGVIAAAGIVALEEMVDRLADDHANARYLAQELANIPGVEIEPPLVQTNILFWKHATIDTPVLAGRLRESGVLCSMVHGRLRMLTHHGIEREDIDDALEIIREVSASLS
jgi:threonine aldolase